MIAIKMPRSTHLLLGSERASRGLRKPRQESSGFSHGEVQARLGLARQGMARPGEAWQGKARFKSCFIRWDMI